MDIRHGLSTVLFDASGEINKNIVLEEGCWYLCSDTVELFVCVNSYDGLTLKKVNEVPDNLLTRDDLADFVYKTDLEGLASKTYVDEKFESIIVPEVDLSNYYNKTETENAINEAINHVEIPEVNLEEYAKKSDIPTDYLKEVPAEYVTEEELNAKRYLTQHQDISHLATKAELPDTSKFITSIPQEYVTENELDAKGYLTSHQSLENYATKAFVEDVIADINIPEVDTENFVTTEGLASALGSKANEIPFTSDAVIKVSIGGFAESENTNINGWSVAEILAKLLGLDGGTSEPDIPDKPEAPDDPDKSIVETIMENEISLYQIDDNDTMVEVPYELLTYAADTSSTTKDDKTGFYVVKDKNGEIIEAGYQHFSTLKEPYYIIALPNSIDLLESGNAEMQSWNTLVTPNKWQTVSKLTLTDDYNEIVATYNADCIEPPVAPDGYKLWADLSTNDPGSSYRFITKE
jgi:hypothetical protein